MAGDGGRVPDVSEQRADHEVSVGAVERDVATLRQWDSNPAAHEALDRLERVALARRGCEFCGLPFPKHTDECEVWRGTPVDPALDHDRCPECGVVPSPPLHNVNCSRASAPSDPASVLAALLAEQPDATITALETLLTSDEVVDEAEEWLMRSSGCANLTDAQLESATRRTIRAACRSLRPKAPKEDR